MLHNETIQFIWETPEFDFKEKSKQWYWIVGVAGIAIIILAIILKNYLFAFFALVGIVLMFLLSNREPMTVGVEVSEQGIKIHDEMFPYERLHAFWIRYNRNQEPILLLLSEKRITPLLSVRINDRQIQPAELRAFLSEFIPEQEMQESVTNRVIDRIGF